MSFHLAGLYRNVGVGSTFVELLPIADFAWPTNPATSRFWSSSEARVFAAYAGGTSLSRARVYSPWRLPNEIRPVNNGVLPVSVPAMASWLSVPMRVPASQDMIFDAVHTNAAAQDIVGLAWLTTEGLTPRPDGDIITIRGDVSGAAPGVRLWSELTSVVWEYILPPGRYAVVGSECISTNAIAHRWILEGSNARPGAVSQSQVYSIPSAYQMYGTLGTWGTFTVPLMPRLEVLCNAADAVHTVFLQVVAL